MAVIQHIPVATKSTSSDMATVIQARPMVDLQEITGNYQGFTF